VQHLTHDNIYEFHVTDLEPFSYDANYTDPALFALGDTQEFEVERVLGHEKRRDPEGKVKRKQLFLFIRWAGYDPSEDSWEPVANFIVQLPMIRDYLTANRLKSYIVESLKDSPEKNPQPRNSRKKRRVAS
jgi:hypothetical protein